MFHQFQCCRQIMIGIQWAVWESINDEKYSLESRQFWARMSFFSSSSSSLNVFNWGFFGWGGSCAFCGWKWTFPVTKVDTWSVYFFLILRGKRRKCVIVMQSLWKRSSRKNEEFCGRTYWSFFFLFKESPNTFLMEYRSVIWAVNNLSKCTTCWILIKST